jgi:mRNA interferase RelE/StbE
VKYSVFILRAAQKDHVRIPSPFYEQIEQRMLALADNPRTPGCKKLKDSAGNWRIRAGMYRILYEIDDARSIVTILRIGHRREVYR